MDVRTEHQTIFQGYNQIVAAAAEHPDLEAVLLLHDDVELQQDPRDLLPIDPTVGVIGVVGAINPGSIGWAHGDARGYAQGSAGIYDHGGGTHDVDLIDGLVMVLAPAATSLRWDERYLGFDGYEADICSKAKAAGLRVIVTDYRVHHHDDGTATYDRPTWIANNLRWQRIWLGRSSPRLRLREVAIRRGLR